MTSSLAKQLAVQASKSVASLDLNAQKQSYSKSLIWEPRVASSQSLQSLHSVCLESYQELCTLDDRLARFSTLFSTQSQDHDRTTQTAAENEVLDRQLESFLRIVGKWLHLTSAVKAVEWLIRRFRLLDMNTQFLITTFLPWHTLPIFKTLLEILPQNLPPVYKFLAPYIKSRTDVPRAAFVHQAMQNRDFVTEVSRYTIDACKAQQGYSSLVSFWGALITEALGGMIDSGRSGWKGRQIDNDQKLLTLFVPILGEAMVVKKAQDLQIASYAAATVFSLKGGLEDSTLSAFMEQLVAGWTSATTGPGIQTLAIMAQMRPLKKRSKKVSRQLLKVPGLPQSLLKVSKKLAVDKLASGVCLYIVSKLSKNGDTTGLDVMQEILQLGLLKPAQTSMVFKALVGAAQEIDDEKDRTGEARRLLGALLTSLAQAPGHLGDTIQKTLSDGDLDLDKLELMLNTALRRNPLPLPPSASVAEDTNASPEPQLSTKSRIETAFSKITATPVDPASHHTSCLFSPESHSPIFRDLCELFLLIAAEGGNETFLEQFESLDILGRKQSTSAPFYLSFYMLVWSGPCAVLARVSALDQVTAWLKRPDAPPFDFRPLLPYGISALSDPSKKVRRAAADMLTVLNNLYANKPVKECGPKKMHDTPDSYEFDDCFRLLSLLLSTLEECILNRDHIHMVVKSTLEGSKALDADKKKNGLSKSFKRATLQFLASYVVKTPSLVVKHRLLAGLNQVSAGGSTTRTSFLLPALQWWRSLPEDKSTNFARQEFLETASLNESFVSVVVANDADGMGELFDILKTDSTKEDLSRAVFARLAHLWPTMKTKPKLRTAETLLDLCFGTDTGSEFVVGESMNLLGSVELGSDILSLFLDGLRSLPRIPAAASPNSKRRRTSSSSGSKPEVELEPTFHDMISKATFVIELVEGSDPAKHPELLDSLFGTLSELQHYKTFIGSELGYLQSLVLKSLLAMIPAYKENKDLKITGSHAHGDLLIHCIQKSTSPSVQNSALLLVAALATTAPDLVLHSVMPIFAFMGTSVLRQSDDYSAHVISQTIKSVVPPLVDSLRKQKRNTIVGTTDLLANFVTAYEHIPSHRKSALFDSLIQTLGPDEFMFAILAMLVDRYGATDDVVSFAAEIMSSYGVETQLQTVAQSLALVADLFKLKPTLSTTIFTAEEHQKRQPSDVAIGQMSLLPRILAGRELRRQVAIITEKDDMEASKVRELYATILESILTLADTVKEDKALHARCGDALANHLNLLSIGEFIKAVENLLDRPNVVLRQRVLRALEVRVDRESQADVKSRTALLAFLPTLTAVIRDSDDIHYKHTAVACVDKIAEKYGKKDIEMVAAAAATIAGDSCLAQSDGRLRNMALLCLASLVDVLQDAIVPIVPTATSMTVKYIEDSLEGAVPNTSLHNAGYHFVTSLAQHLPYITTGKHLDRILAASLSSADKNLDEEANETRRECLELLARQVDAKAIFTALEHTWEKAATSEHVAIREYFQVLSIALDKHAKSAVSKNLPSLSMILTGALDLRRLQRQAGTWTSQSSAEIESLINQAALKIIYKLNDATFRPLFSSLVDWALSLPLTDVVGQISRLQSLYGFLEVFFDNIKSAVTSYASYILDSAVQFLTTVDLKDGEQTELWRRVLRTLTKCFEHDGSDFWQAPAHFSAIAPTLSSQLAKAASVSVKGELIPAVVELASAADSNEHHKELNTAVLKQLKSEVGAVRLAAVLCQQGLVDRHGDEWLQALPEMLPYISELQDDDDDVVERETHRWITKIEGVLGESLDAMLQ